MVGCKFKTVPEMKMGTESDPSEEAGKFVKL